MTHTLGEAVAAFGALAKAKLQNAGATGQPEDQLRAPFEALLGDVAELVGFARAAVIPVGESAISDMKTRPDYAVTVRGALAGHIELKAPGKGADPRRFRDPHDKSQWERLRALPNLIYTDGNQFSLWHSGELAVPIVRLAGDIESAGTHLSAPAGLLALFEQFLQWQPIAPRSARELAHLSARLCRLLRDEVTEQLERKSPELTSLAADWRKLLFPEATDETFADGYAQAVTFGLLMARAKKIELATGFHMVALELGHTSTLIGAALQLLTNDGNHRAILKTSLDTMVRVLDEVSWQAVSKGEPEAWLYFYEEFLEVYDNALRKMTGSYYTPPEVVEAMVRLVDEELRGPRFALYGGIASPAVTLADPATGTGTFLLGILRRIAATVRADEGVGAVPGRINAALSRLIAFEMQLGPFAVAELRLLAEVFELTGALPSTRPRLFVTDTLGSPDDDDGWLPGYGPFKAIAETRKDANRVKRDEPITVVIGNPPYKEKAMGRGGWVEGRDRDASAAPLADWRPPKHLRAHAKHLRNLYVYFWRWATWKVFDDPEHDSGVVCFITVAGFLGGPGFETMREYLRRRCDAIWVIDCSPEGHQPEVPTRVFQGVQQPVCIVIASRGANPIGVETPARTRFQALPEGRREAKFDALREIGHQDSGWVDCAVGWGAPFLPESSGEWSSFPALVDLFEYDGSGVQPKRTWVIAPDAGSLEERWNRLRTAPTDRKEELFHATLRNGLPADRHIRSVVAPIPGFADRGRALVSEDGPVEAPVPYGWRSFDRQWIIPDARLITQPNATLWTSRSRRQVYLTALARTSPTSGPALAVSANVPDLDHYNGRGGRVFPLWADAAATEPNVRLDLLGALSKAYGEEVHAEEVFAYIVGIAAHHGFVGRFRADMATPGLRIPFTADAELFGEVAEAGRRVVWLQTFGERMADASKGRPPGPPRLPSERRPHIPADGAIPSEPERMPDSLDYDASRQRLLVGAGFVENVPAAAWLYEVSGKHVLRQWFSYRKKDRSRPIMGDRRPPSKLSEIQPDHWLPEYTTELLNVINVLGLLAELEPEQARLLAAVCEGPTISEAELRAAGAFEAAELGAGTRPKGRGRRGAALDGAPRLLE